jgi:hypothetical protein
MALDKTLIPVGDEQEQLHTPEESVVGRLLNALWIAAEALDGHGDETTLPYILQIIRSVEESW